MADMLEVLGDRTCAVGRELTKVHEQLVVRPISRLLADLGEPIGEFTLVVAPPDPTQPDAVVQPSDASLAQELGEMTDIAGLDRKEALRELADKYAMPKREVYAAVVRHRDSVK
jgi:16S rRNA (cytidine1402-2'-O)-methyltransferase